MRELLRQGEVEVTGIVSALLEDLAPRLAQRSLRAALRGAKPAPAWGDRRAIEQVLSNLIDNAVKYSDEGDTIDVTIDLRPDRVEIAVADTGIGIPAADLSRVFERFYRVDKARSRALGGTGLGLAIVKHLVQGMGGDIRVESQLGKGSTFRFWLPTRPADPSEC